MSAWGPSLLAGASVVVLVLGLGRCVAVRSGRGPAPAPALGASPARVPRALRPLERRLERAGAPVGPLGALAAAGGVAATVGALGWRLTGSPLVIPLALGLAVVAVASGLRLASARTAGRLAGQLPQVARSLAASVGAGLSLSRAMERAAADAPEPMAGELAVAVQEIRLGARVDDALEALAGRVGSRDLRVLVTAIIVQRRTGGDLARALAQLAERLDERQRLRRELRGVTAQARLTAWMVAALPVAAGAMAELAAPGMLGRALGQGVGPILLVVCLVLYGIGVLLVRRIGRVAL